MSLQKLLQISLYTLPTLHLITIVSVSHPTYQSDDIFIFGDHWEVLDVSFSFRVHLYGMFSACILKFLLRPLVYGTTMVVLFFFRNVW